MSVRIKPNEVVFVKITNEPVFVLAVNKEGNPLVSESNVEFRAYAIVRRSAESPAGRQYQQTYFRLAELETFEERLAREIEWAEARVLAGEKLKARLVAILGTTAKTPASSVN